MKMDLFITAKSIVSFIGGLFIIVGVNVEPSVGVWVISLGGTLLTVSLGSDKTVKGILLYMVMGLFWGVFGSQVIHATTQVPQVAGAFFAAMFGAEMTWFLIRSMREGSVGEFLIDLIAKLNPFSGIKITKKGSE
jgi:hypothetical protein